MKILGQLELACLEQLASDPSVNTAGRIWMNTTFGQTMLDNGVNKRALLRNDEKCYIGQATLGGGLNIRLHRGSPALLQLVIDDDTTPDGTVSNALAILSTRIEGYASTSKPATGNIGRLIYLTDTETLSLDQGGQFIDLLSSFLFQTKGDLIIGTPQAGNRLPVGGDNTVLTADSTQTLGVRWASPGVAPTSLHSSAFTAAVGAGLYRVTNSGGNYVVTLPTAVDGEKLAFLRADSNFTTNSKVITINGFNLCFANTLLTLRGVGASWITESYNQQVYWQSSSLAQSAFTDYNVTGGWSGIGTVDIYKRHIHDTIEVKGSMNAATWANSPATIADNFNTPNISITDRLKVPLGHWWSSTPTSSPPAAYDSNNLNGFIYWDQVDGQFHFAQAGASGVAVPANALSIGGNGGTLHFAFSYPVNGY